MAESWSPDDYTLLPDALAIGTWLCQLDPEQAFPFAADARICYLQQAAPLMLRGERVAAYIAALPVQGVHRHLWSYLVSGWAGLERELPDFLIYVDRAAWAAFDDAQDLGPSGHPLRREALIYHELCHLVHKHTPDGSPCFHVEDGRPVLALRRHTYEFFNTEATRYGDKAATFDLAALERDVREARQTSQRAFRRHLRAV